MEIGEVSKNVSIKSYVIYDLETTTLPCYGVAKITELCAIGVIRDHVLNLSEGEDQPRVLNKITLCINPRKMVSLESESLTGLSNDMLETSSPFNECVFGMLEDFINRLPQPVCLIAHNGNKFDFPILQSEIHHIGKKFADHLWCADSLPAFRYLYVDQPRELFMESQSTSKIDSQTVEMESILYQFNEMDSVLCDALDSAEKTLQDQGLNVGFRQTDLPLVPSGSPHEGLSAFEAKSSVLSSPPRMSSMQKINETTPKRPVSSPFVPKVARASAGARQSYCYTPDPKKSGTADTSPRRKVPVRSLIKEFNDSLVDCPKSFTLANIFTHVCRRQPLPAHTAESDSIMLLQSIVACRGGFLQWVDENATPFNSIKPFRY